jgi:quercetin dioxygenase-like cupin family protein
MLGKLFWNVTFVCLVFGTALAQDPTKVEPTHYRRGFENEHVDVVYVHYGPHEKSVMHDHPGGVVVNLTGGHLRFVDQNGTTTEVNAKPGEARWFAPFKHRVENLGDTPYNAVYIGVKQGSSRASLKGNASAVDEQTAQLVAAILASSKR